jgi:tetratricopeptide (TPR) repeat protein
MTGLVVDPQRQAKDALRGYIFQVLRSVAVWLDLGDREELYLEGAEDLDRVTGQDALVEQVKDTAGSGNITLRTVSVIEAINNYWNHRDRNPDHRVSFRYLTTSGIGTEQGQPFGPGQAGLSLWADVRNQPLAEAAERVRELADFLAGTPAISPTVKAFLATATTDDVIESLIRPIEWITGQQDGTALVRRIMDRLVVHGAAANVAPADAEQAFYPLYAAAFDAAKAKDDVPLTRAEFLRIFGGATAIQLPKQEIAALLRAAMAPSGTGLAVQSRQLVLEGRPPVAPRYFARRAIEDQLRAALTRGPALLHGATGTGKTMLAASALRSVESAWIALRDCGPAEVKARLLAARDALRADRRALTLVLDDLDGLGDHRQTEGALSALWVTQQELGGRLLLTSDRPLPARLAQAIDLQAAAELQMPPFDLEEIRGFLAQEGCPDDRISTWANVLELMSLGHPQLLHARIAALQASGFPQPTPGDFLNTPPDVDRVRTEARRLVADLPVDARELLYRTSLVTSRMSRNRLMAIARIETALAEPGTAIDMIAGPWLELTDTGDFRVSPLVRGAAEQARGQAWAKAMHGKLAWIFLLERSITPWDISAILGHSLLSGSASPLAHIMPSLFAKSDETWAHIAEACDMFTGLALEPGTKLPFERPIDGFIFRAFQYRIAAVDDPETAMRIAAQFDAETSAISLDDGTRFFRFLFLSQLLQRTSVHYPMASLVRHALEFMTLARELSASFPERLARSGMTLEEGETLPNYEQFIALPLLHDILDREQFDTFFAVIAGLPRGDAAGLLSALAGPDEQAAMVIERVWLAEYRKQRDQWEVVRQSLSSALRVSQELGVTVMARAIAPVLVRMIEEELGDAPAALAEAERLTVLFGDDPALQCAMARVLNKLGEADRALELWKDAMPRWPRGIGNFTSAFAGRDAAIAAGKAGRWAESAAFFEGSATLMTDGGNPTFWLGLRMDAGLSYFMADDHAQAIARFGEVIAALAPMQPDLDSEPVLSLQRRSGGVLAAIMRWNLEGGATDEAPNLVGMCSNLDPFKTDAPLAPPLDFLIMDLFRIDLAYGADMSLADYYADTLRATPILSLRVVVAPYLFEFARRTRRFETIVREGLIQADALTEGADQRSRGVIAPMAHADGVARPWMSGAHELLLANMITAVFDLAAANELDSLPLVEWRSAARANPEAGSISSLVDYLEALFVSGEIDPWEDVLKPRSQLWTEHLMASLAATILQPLTPEPLMICHGYWVSYLAKSHLSAMIASSIGMLVAGQWAAMCRVPRLMASPATSVPAILMAVAAPSTGWQRARTVLVAAMEAAPRASDDVSRAAIEAIDGVQ